MVSFGDATAKRDLPLTASHDTRRAIDRLLSMPRRYRAIPSSRRSRPAHRPRGQHIPARQVALARLRGRRKHDERVSTLARLGGTLAIFLATMLLLIAGVGASVAVASWNYFTEDLPAIDQFEARQFETTRIYDRNWTLLYEVSDPEYGWRTYLSLDEITNNGQNMNLVNATIAAEDKTFWTNYGVEPLAVIRGAFITATGRGSFGGSTIAQQLVRQLFPEKIGFERSYERKVREAIVAVQMTETYSKEEILELYLNTIYYGNRAYGIDAAAQAYFNKHPWELDLAEASMLAGLPQAPSYYDPTVNMEAAKARQRYVLDQVASQGFVSQAQADAAWDELLDPQTRENRYNLAPHWVNFVIDTLEGRYGAEKVYRGGLQVRTTLDYALQQQAEESVRDHLAELAPYDASNGALVAMLPGSGEVVAMVGSADYTNDAISGQVNVAVSERQPGSAFMPITYAAAFEHGWYPGTVIL
ncbi:MAG TPA: transglycosylase domain-containing protein, partial [Thermomicrobiales bacterium]|nr:transglycosylase domain-containing protein [Thermomicrobiales bacterium]